MKIFMRLAAGLLVAIALFLVYAVIHAAASTAGARVGVCIAYIVGAAVLVFLATRLWAKSSGPRGTSTPGAASLES
jgi:threonine/homoserine/homoserine lactone efflux protein